MARLAGERDEPIDGLRCLSQAFRRRRAMPRTTSGIEQDRASTTARVGTSATAGSIPYQIIRGRKRSFANSERAANPSASAQRSASDGPASCSTRLATVLFDGAHRVRWMFACRRALECRSQIEQNQPRAVVRSHLNKRPNRFGRRRFAVHQEPHRPGANALVVMVQSCQQPGVGSAPCDVETPQGSQLVDRIGVGRENRLLTELGVGYRLVTGATAAPVGG